MRNSLKTKILTAVALLLSMMAHANEASNPATTNTASSDNMLLYFLISGCAVLLVAVLFLGNIWVKLTRMVYEKRSAKATLMLLLVFGAHFVYGQTATPEPAADNVFSLPVPLDILAGMIVFGLEVVVVIWMLLSIRNLLSELSDEKKEAKAFQIHLPRLFDNLNASVAVEKESDIMLDHDYDGIRELDNSLPPWWKYSFYISIVWSVFYLGYYFIGGGPSSTEEYAAEVLQAKIEVEAYTRKNALNVDENNITLANEAGILDGQEIFKTNCAACHGNDGQGVVGPNLTDNYWLHGGSLSDIFKSVKYGWPAKGMKSWESDLSPVQIKNVVSYIHSLQGTNPANAKAPEGNLFAENTGGPDSTVVALTDSIQK